MPTSAFSNVFIKDSLIDSTFLKFLWRFIFRFTDCGSAIACFAIMCIYITNVAPLLKLASISNRTFNIFASPAGN